MAINEGLAFPREASVPNPTYGVSYRSSDQISEASTNSDYFSVSVTSNPMYHFVGAKKSSRSPTREGSIENGVQIPVVERNGHGTSRPNSIGSSHYNAVDDSHQTGTPPVPLINISTPVPFRSISSQVSHTSEISSSIGSNDPIPDEKQNTPVISSGYSYARHHTGRGKGHYEERETPQPTVVFSGKTTHIEEENEDTSRLDPFQETSSNRSKRNVREGISTRQNISYEKVTLKYRTTGCNLDDTSIIDIVIGVFAVLSIVLSLLVIILCVVMITKDSSTTSNGSTSTTTTINNNNNNNNNGDTSQSAAMNSTNGFCNCTGYVNTAGRNLELPNTLMQRLNVIQLNLTELQQNNVSISVTSQRLNNLLSQLNSINDSIEQIKIQANQSRTVDLNLPASLDIDISSGCIVERQQPCVTTILGYCLTLTNFFEEGRIVVDLTCNPFPVNGDPNFQGGSSIRIDITTDLSMSSPDVVFEQLLGSRISCYCISYDPSIVANCVFYVTRCPFQRQTLNTTFYT